MLTQFWERTCAVVFWVTSLGSNPSKGRKATFYSIELALGMGLSDSVFLSVKASPTHNFCLLCQHLFCTKYGRI